MSYYLSSYISETFLKYHKGILFNRPHLFWGDDNQSLSDIETQKIVEEIVNAHFYNFFICGEFNSYFCSSKDEVQWYKKYLKKKFPFIKSQIELFFSRVFDDFNDYEWRLTSNFLDQDEFTRSITFSYESSLTDEEISVEEFKKRGLRTIDDIIQEKYPYEDIERGLKNFGIHFQSLSI